MPLVSKVCNIRMVPLAIDIVTTELTGKPSPVPELKEQGYSVLRRKESVFPFNMFQEVDPLLGPEMRSTGEVTRTCPALWRSVLQSTGGNTDKASAGRYRTDLRKQSRQTGSCRSGTGILYARIQDHRINHTLNCSCLNNDRSGKINKLQEGRPNMLDLITNEKIDIIVNTPSGKKAK